MNSVAIKKFTLIFLSFVLFFSLLEGQNKITITNPDVIQGRLVKTSIPVRDFVPDPNIIRDTVRFEKPGITGRDWPIHPVLNPNALPAGPDPVMQRSLARNPSRSTIISFDGIGYQPLNPADPSVDVGPNHVIHMINGSSGSLVKIFDKSGGTIQDQFYFDDISGIAGAGDPIVLYDQIADRWFLSEFSSSGNRMVIGISATSDPTGSYHIYEFTAPSFPDYPKFSVWPDAYYATTNENQTAVYAFDRAQMLDGNPATMQRFTMASFPTIGFQAGTPVSIDGPTAPPADSPGIIMRMADDAWSGSIPADRLEMYEFSVDWDTPANSTFTGPTNLNTEPFDTHFCGYTTFSCIQQPSGPGLDPLREVLMNKIIYRNFGSYEALVCNHITDVDGTDHAGVRWYELRRPSGGSWSIYQQGTLAPDDDNRWMAGIAINAQGDIGLAYSVSGSSTFPSLRYTARRDCDPLGTMTVAETELATGTASNASNRWGDYFGLSVDPANGEDFWFGGVYNTSSQWRTNISAFNVESCSPSISFTASEGIAYEADANVENNCLDYFEYQFEIKISLPPSAPADINLTLGGTAGTNDYSISPSSLTLDAGNLEEQITVQVFDDRYIETAEELIVGYTFSANGGDAQAGSGNQQHILTIYDDDYLPKANLDSIDFENGFEDYTTVNLSGATAYQINTGAGASSTNFTIPDYTNFAYVNDDGCDCDMADVRLFTPGLDLSRFISASLEFDAFYLDNTYQGDPEDVDILISTDGGMNYNSIYVLPETDPWDRLTLDLSAYTGVGFEDVKIAFRYNDGGGWLYGFAIDNIVIKTETDIQTTVNDLNPDEQYLGPNETVYFYDPVSGNVMMKIENLSSHDYGCTSVYVNASGTNFTSTNPNTGDIADKTFMVVPDNNTNSGNYNITLYYKDAEIMPWSSPSNNCEETTGSLSVINSPSLIQDEMGIYNTGSTNGVVTYNGMDYEFSANFTSALGGFGIGDNVGRELFYVKNDAGGDNNGLSWDDAYTSLQNALDMAANCNTEVEIRVAKGTYIPSKDMNGDENPADERTKTFFIGNNVTILGSFSGNPADPENSDPSLRDFVNNPSVMSGDLQQDDLPNNVNIGDNAYHIFYIDNEGYLLELDGLIISASNGPSAAGIYCEGVVEIENAIIERCISDSPGSAIKVTGENHILTIENSELRENDPEDIDNSDNGQIIIRGNVDIRQ